MLSSSSRDPPLKDEVMEIEFTQDDHRKRRRNRTTQSCLNCHNSKRKCDRKRPCHRCIQLGLTGLCVYEVDDPAASALGDDGDETTRLRNRVAELETLVRELRGKPHPRWAESNSRDADPSEKWHSRANRPDGKRRELVDEHDGNSRNRRAQTLLSLAGPLTPPLYHLSPSPPPVRSPGYDRYESENHGESRRNVNSNNYYHAQDVQSSPSTSFHHEHNLISHSRPYVHHHFSHDAPSPQSICSCRTTPANAHAYISLVRQLQETLEQVSQYSPHTNDTGCLLYRRIVELHNLMQGNDPSDFAGPKYAHAEVMSPMSFQSSPTVSPTEWNSPVGYNPYFPG